MGCVVGTFPILCPVYRFKGFVAWIVELRFLPYFNLKHKTPHALSARIRDLVEFEELRSSTLRPKTMGASSPQRRSAQRECFAADFPNTKTPVEFR